MSEKKRLLEVRKTIKDKKPEFKQQDFHKKKRLSDKWKRPRGLQSKMRHQFKGYHRLPKQGWRSPVEVRGIHQKGYEAILVYNVSDLSKIKKDQAIIIAGNVGNKKRLDIITKAEELKIIVLNIKVDKFKEKIAKQKEDKTKEKVEKTEKKKKTIEDSLKKAEKREKDKEKKDKSASTDADAAADAGDSDEKSDTSADEKAKAEKKIKDDVLIHKDV